MKIIQWACQFLSTHGYTLKSHLPDDVQNTPWSYVARFATSDGYIYLKHTPKLLALETKIIKVLHDKFHASVPNIIADNAELNCFLMNDAGRPLREILKKNFDTELLCEAINQFTALQISVADHASNFIDIGVPDWRLEKLPDLYAQLLTEKDLLIEDGLSENEIRQLEMLIPTVTSLCTDLSQFSIKQTIVQPDFNDNNTLIDESSHKITFIDLGEIVISHPFFSLLNCLQQIKKHHALTEDDDAYLRISNACISNYSAFDSHKNVSDALTLARPLWFVYSALAGQRLINACGKSKIMAYQHGKLIASLKEFLKMNDSH